MQRPSSECRSVQIIAILAVYVGLGNQLHDSRLATRDDTRAVCAGNRSAWPMPSVCKHDSKGQDELDTHSNENCARLALFCLDETSNQLLLLVWRYVGDELGDRFRDVQWRPAEEDSVVYCLQHLELVSTT